MKQLLLMLSFLSLFTSLQAQQLQTRMWYPEVLTQIKSQIGNGNTIYTESLQKLQKEADKWLSKPNPTIVNKPVPPESGDKHDYMSLGKYWWPNPNTSNGLPYIRRDGKINPEIEKFDRRTLGEFVDGTVKLTLAYYYSDKKTYADKAVSMIKTWYLDTRTKQNPNMNFAQAVPGVTSEKGRPEGIIDASGFIYVTDAIEILHAKGQLTDNELGDLKKWFVEFCNWLTNNPLGTKEGEAANNHSMAYDVQLTRYSLFTGDVATATRVIKEFYAKRLLPQIEDDGKQPLELARVTSFHYSIANLGHMIDLCDLGKQLKILVYSTGQKKGSIDMALQYLIPYINDASKFPYKDETKNWNSEAGTLVNLIYRASFHNPEMREKYVDIYRHFKGNDYLFKLTYLRP
jgi:Alginate lyase